jgi:hypothetical protein
METPRYERAADAFEPITDLQVLLNLRRAAKRGILSNNALGILTRLAFMDRDWGADSPHDLCTGPSSSPEWDAMEDGWVELQEKGYVTVGTHAVTALGRTFLGRDVFLFSLDEHRAYLAREGADSTGGDK